MEAKERGVVIDNGSEIIKAGFAGDDEIKVCIPNLEAGGLVGAAAVESEADWHVPMSQSKIDDWDTMETIWRHLFTNELQCEPAEQYVFLSEGPKNPRVKREKTAEVLFEKFNVRGMYLQLTSMLSLFASGRTTGLVLDCGADICSAFPVAEGTAIPAGMLEIPCGANHVTDFMQKLLNENANFPLGKQRNRYLARDVKDALSYVALDMDEELEKFEDDSKTCARNYTLPDGRSIEVGMERFAAGEVLFQPELVGVESHGVQKLIFDSTQACDIDLRTPLYANVVLSGGSTMMPGFGERAKFDLEQVCPQSSNVRVESPDERVESVWIGGSVIASLPNFYESEWVTRAEYDEQGARIVGKKCVVYDPGLRT